MSTLQPPTNRPAPRGRHSSTEWIEYERYIDTQVRRTRRKVKLVELASAVVVLVVGLMAFLLTAALLEHWILPGGLGMVGRILLFCMLMGALGYYLVKRVWPLVTRPINPNYAAATIEQGFPTLKNSLINLLLFRADRDKMPPAVFDAIEEQAAQRLSQAPVDQSVDRGPLIRWGYVLLGVITATVLYMMVSPKSTLATAGRVLMPWSDIATPSRVRITDIAPGSVEIIQGDTLEVTARVRGLRPEEGVHLSYDTADKQLAEQLVAMRPLDETGRYGVKLPADDSSSGIQQDLRYRIIAGDGRSVDFDVRALTAPSIRVAKVHYDFPAYTGATDRTVERRGDILAIDGTKITIYAEANSEIESAHVDLAADGTNDRRMRVEGSAAQVTFDLTLPRGQRTPQQSSYLLQMTNTEGVTNRHPPQHRLEILPDTPPEIDITEPTEPAREVQLNETVAMRVRAWDNDYALSEVTLRFVKGNDREVATIDLLASDDPQQERLDGRYEFTAVDHDLQPGDVVEYWAEAVDNRQPQGNRTLTTRRELVVVAPPDDQAQQGPNQRKDQQRGDQPQQPENNDPQAGQDQQQNPEGGQAADGQQEQGAQGEAGDQGQPPQNGQPGDQPQQQGEQPNQQQQGQQQQGEQRQGEQQQGEQQQGQQQQGEQQQGEQQQGEQQQGGQQQGEQQQDQQGGQNEQGMSNSSPEGESGDQGQASDAGAQQQQPGEGQQGGAQDQPGSGGDTPQPSGEGGQAGNHDANQGQADQPVAKDGSDDATALEKMQEHLSEKQRREGTRRPGESSGDPSTAQADSGDPPSDRQGEQRSPDTNPSDQRPDQQQRQGENAGAKTPGGQAPEDKEPSADQSPEASKSGGAEDPGRKGEAGAGEETSPEGAPKPQEDSDPRKKQNDAGETGEKSDKQEPPMSGRGDHESDSRGESGGENPGGGEEGGGQKANREGTGSAGQNQAADEGGGQSQDEGPGDAGNEAGDAQQAGRETGKAGSERGTGSETRQAPSQENGVGEDDAGQPGEGQPGEGQPGEGQPGEGQPPGEAQQPPGRDPGDAAGEDPSQDAAAERSQSQEPGQGEPGEQPPRQGEQPPGEGRAGSTPTQGEASSSEGDAPPRDYQLQEADKANLEYAKKETNMVLESLEEQLKNKQVDQELLDKLGWTEQDLKQFVDRWQRLRQAAAADTPEGKAAQQKLDERLRKLGPKRQTISGDTVRKQDEVRDLGDGYRGEIPRRFRERVQRYTEGISGSGDQQSR